jgi:hypothetical protein
VSARWRTRCRSVSRKPPGAAPGEYLRRTAGLAGYTPDVIRHFASQDYRGIDVEHRLGEVINPVMGLPGFQPGLLQLRTPESDDLRTATDTTRPIRSRIESVICARVSPAPGRVPALPLYELDGSSAALC